MAKGGKFSCFTGGAKVDFDNAVKGASIRAVIKALNALTIAIRKTIDAGLKAVKDAMKINPNDTPLTTEAGVNK
ncbi:variable large family protein (plasmid) [Borrelia coriaceae]|uniref:Variable large protein n=1 Tax=Borrelia coriaceae ATCC 43381 TaxID=1408429 RepID=W5T2A2_9SPIR|nr:Variable outer membrane protein [Borrelia coriaceae ATCC 43381]UPA17413.1 variable large family protein [Borrelia coriaceae]